MHKRRQKSKGQILGRCSLRITTKLDLPHLPRLSKHKTNHAYLPREFWKQSEQHIAVSDQFVASRLGIEMG